MSVSNIKILTKEGYDYANFSVPIYKTNREDEKFSALKAVTYNFEGGRVVETKMKPEALFREKVDGNVELIKFTLPNIKEGSVLEVTYKTFSPFLRNFPDWDFQTTIPTRYSEYRANIPEYFDYRTYQQGYIAWPVQEHEKKSKTFVLDYRVREGHVGSTVAPERLGYVEHNYRWAVDNVPAFKAEPHMTTYRDFVSSINFELAYARLPNGNLESYSGSWDEVAKDFLESENFGGHLKSSDFLKEIAVSAAGASVDRKATIASIYRYVKENVAWNGSDTKYVSKNLKKVWDDKSGNAAEINLLLVALLQHSEVVAHPLLISTRDFGFIRKEIPASKKFNYVLACVKLEEQYLLLDGTDRSLPMSVLPSKCVNGEGLLIAERSIWVPLIGAKNRSILSADLHLDSAGVLAGKVEILHDGYEAQRARIAYAKEGDDSYASQVSTRFGWEPSNYKLQNMTHLHEPVKEEYEVKFLDFMQESNKVIYLNPILGFRIDDNPFKLEKREYPVDFGYAQEKLLTMKIRLGEGITVEEIPPAKALLLPNKGGRFSYNIVQNGNLLLITNHFTINQPMFSQLEYPGLREFFAQVVAKQAEQIVLKRK